MPNPQKANDRTCEELRAALEAAQASIEPPSERTGFQGAQGAQIVTPTPEVNQDVYERIRNLEQALREAGCEE